MMNKSKILIVAPHPDDETLGCGGALLRHASEGDELYWLIVTNIVDEMRWGKQRILEREEEIQEVSKHYGFKDVFRLPFEPTTLTTIGHAKIIEEISKVVKKVKPNIVYIPNRSDVHSDHRIIFEACISSLKIFNNPSIKKILMYETLSETNFSPALCERAFIPNYYVDITHFLEKKVEIMKIYKTEIKNHPFPRSEDSIRALAILRGAEAGMIYAESFILIKYRY